MIRICVKLTIVSWLKFTRAFYDSALSIPHIRGASKRTNGAWRGSRWPFIFRLFTMWDLNGFLSVTHRMPLLDLSATTVVAMAMSYNW